MRDLLVVAGLVLLFATALTAHVAIVAGLSRRSPRWHGAVALVVPPLAPYWAFRGQMRARAVVWLVAVIGYGAIRVLWRT